MDQYSLRSLRKNFALLLRIFICIALFYNLGVPPQRGSGVVLSATIFCKEQAKGFPRQSLTQLHEFAD
jgi:C4-dicarboxylate transporter